jgi:hypothetical protein
LLTITYRLSHDNIRKRDNVNIYVQITNPGSTEVNIERIELATIADAFFALDDRKRTFSSWIRRERISRKQIEHDNINHSIAAGSTYVEIFEITIDGAFPYFVPRAETYRLGCVVHYEEKSTPPKKSQQVGFIEMNIRAPFIAIATGAIIGSVLGTVITKSSTNFNWSLENAGAFIGAMIINMILAFVAVVVLQRKKDVQSFITIEDIWGGLVIGFVVAYGGVQFFNRILPSLDGVGSAAALPVPAGG